MSIVSAVLKFLYLPISILYFKHYIFPIRKEKVFTTIFLTYISIFFFSKKILPLHPKRKFLLCNGLSSTATSWIRKHLNL